jgi:hypothetical protein
MISTAPDDAPDFAQPSGVEMATIDPASGGLATEACPRKVELPFLLGTAPTQLCSLHGGMFASAPMPPPPIPTEGTPPSSMPQPSALPSPANSDVFGKLGSLISSLFH